MCGVRMRRSGKFVFAGVLLTAVVFCSQARATDLPNGDFQYWSPNSVDKKINNDWKVAVGEETRLGNGASWIYYQHAEGGIIYSGLAKWLDLAFFYRQVYFRDVGDKWHQEERPFVNISLKGEFYGFKYTDRNRFEYRMIDNVEDHVQYRNKLSVLAPIKWTRYELQPLVEEEVFYSFLRNRWVSSELTSGLRFKLMKNMSVDVYYLVKNSWVKADKWKEYNVVGTTVRCSF
jgi:hypothetical protein